MEAKRNAGCRHDGCPNIKICTHKSINSTNVWFELWQRRTAEASFFFLTILFPCRVQFGHKWWHDKYPGYIRPPPSALKRFFGYHSHDIPCASFQLLKVVVFYLEDAVRNSLSHTILDGWIGKGEPISWLPRSADATPLKFFVLGCVKTLVGSLEKVDRLKDVGLYGRMVPFCPPRLRRCVS